MFVEIECVAALDAQEFAVDSGAVAIVPAYDFIVAHAQGSLAAVRAVRAYGSDVLHLPRARMVTIGPAGQRAHRANIDAHAAFVALQMVAFVRHDLGDYAAVGYAQGLHAHAFVADAHAAIAEDAAGIIE